MINFRIEIIHFFVMLKMITIAKIEQVDNLLPFILRVFENNNHNFHNQSFFEALILKNIIITNLGLLISFYFLHFKQINFDAIIEKIKVSYHLNMVLSFCFAFLEIVVITVIVIITDFLVIIISKYLK